MRLSGTKTNSIHQYRGLGDQLWDISGTRPSLDLRFADSKSLVDATTGQNLVTFTRASSGTYVGSDGLLKTATTNEPRFDHNPTTGESLGLLVEEQRTNLLLRSEDLTTTWIAFGSTVTANGAVAPDGTTTADKLINNTANSEHGIYQVTTTSGANTFTVFAKQAELRYLVLRRDSTPLLAVYDLQTGTVSQTDAGVTAAITPFPNGWYRCSMTCSTPTGNTVIKLSDVGTGVVFNSTYTGTAGQGILIWGAQLEAGAFPTSYIPTTTATATRSADVASITGTNFSSWYNQTQGTLCSTTSSVPNTLTAQARNIFAISDGGNSEHQTAYRAGNFDNYTVQTRISGVLQFSPVDAGNPDYLNDRVAYSYGATGGTVSSKGLTVTTSSADLSVIAANQLRLTATGSELNGTIRRLTYWPARLANSTLQDITR